MIWDPGRLGPWAEGSENAHGGRIRPYEGVWDVPVTFPDHLQAIYGGLHPFTQMRTDVTNSEPHDEIR